MGRRVCIIGGKLQGLEALYLAKKAGYEAWLVDKSRGPPGIGLSDDFFCIDVVKDADSLSTIIRKTDAVLPCLEDKAALASIERVSKKEGACLLHDSSAFLTTSDKLSFYRLCDSLSVKYPPLIPHAKYPLIAKPNVASGSRGVRMVKDEEELLSFGDQTNQSVSVIQEYASGAFLSLEVLCLGENACPLQITGLEFDETYGCKRVMAPIAMDETLKDRIDALGAKIAAGLPLKGLMDLQVVVRDGNDRVEVIESNARLPSQTPTVVFLSSGENILELLMTLFLDNRLPSVKCSSRQAVIYQHLIFKEGEAFVGAEHNLSEAKNLRIEHGFHGCAESITNLPGGGNPKGSVATLMATGANLGSAKSRMEEAIKSICQHYKVSLAREQAPWGMVSIYGKIDSPSC